MLMFVFVHSIVDWWYYCGADSIKSCGVKTNRPYGRRKEFNTNMKMNDSLRKGERFNKTIKKEDVKKNNDQWVGETTPAV